MHQFEIKDTGLTVTELGYGGTALGDMPDTYGYSVSEDQARDTLHAIFDGPVNLLDTSNNYGFGRSEERIGAVLRERGGLPDGFVLSTKIDRDMETGRFDEDRVKQSVEESLTRLGLDKIPLLHLHDPEYARDLSEVTGDGGALDALFKLKDEGVATAVGLAMGRLDLMEPLVRDWPFDAIISHNRFTLLNRSADALFNYCADEDIAVLNAAPYAGGVLATGADAMPRLTYQEATAADLEPVRRLEAVCAQWRVPLPALALQFSLRDPRITSTIVGVSTPEHVTQTLASAKARIPQMVWDEIMALPFSTADPEANRTYRPG